MPRLDLTMDQRWTLTELHREGLSHAAIARRLGRHRATVGRELRRNRDARGGYHAESAQRRAEQRRIRRPGPGKLEDSGSALGQAVRRGLLERWSPQQISERLKRDHPRDPAMRVSPEAIYQWVYHDHAQGGRWYEKLRRRRKRRRGRIAGERKGKRGVIPGRVGIEHRPAAADDRRRYGDWESDTVEGAKGTGQLATHVERKSRYTCLGKLEDKKAASFTAVTRRALGKLPARLRRTLTADNGKEFADFKTIESTLNLDVYFANPHAPWERGANENTNGLLRDWWPKGSDFSRITRAEVARVEAMLNNRPRKCLDYRTPAEVLGALPGVALGN